MFRAAASRPGLLLVSYRVLVSSLSWSRILEQAPDGSVDWPLVLGNKRDLTGRALVSLEGRKAHVSKLCVMTGEFFVESKLRADKSQRE